MNKTFRASTLLVGIWAAFSSLQVSAASYVFKQHAAGLVGAPTQTQPSEPPPAPGYVGDGVSKAGACASGQATGCTTWDTTVQYMTSFTDGNLTATHQIDNGTAFARSALGKSTGKWYWEYTMSSPDYTSGKLRLLVGLIDSTYRPGSTKYWLNDGNTSLWGMYSGFYPSSIYVGCSPASWPWSELSQAFPDADNYSVGDVAGIALDMTTKTMTLYKNGVALGGGARCSNLAGTVHAVMGNGGTRARWAANFGQSNFAYAVPAGFNKGLW